MRIFQGIFIAGLFIIVGGYLFYKSTPEYAIKQLVEGLEQHDRQKVQTFMDKDLVINSLIEEYLAENPDVNSSQVSNKINTFSNMVFMSYFLPEKFGRRDVIDLDVEVLEVKMVSQKKESSLIAVKISHKSSKKIKDLKIVMKKFKHWKLVSVLGLAQELKKVSLL